MDISEHRKKDTQSIQEVLSQIIQYNPIGVKILETRIVKNWSHILGESVKNNTKEIFFNNGVLYVRMQSPVVANELVMVKDKIISALNESVGRKLLFDIRFI